MDQHTASNLMPGAAADEPGSTSNHIAAVITVTLAVPTTTTLEGRVYRGLDRWNTLVPPGSGESGYGLDGFPRNWR